MKRSLYLVSSLVPVLLLAPALAQQSGEIETAFVYKPDGTQHCNPAPGVSLESMAQELVRAGISVYTQRRSHDGREGIAVCGDPTGGINVYEIAESGVPRALQSGFQRLDASWLEAQ